jgi:hypothetical protein
MIIDSHCHAGKGDGLTGPWDTAAPLGHYLRRASKAGIHRTVLLPAFHSDYRVANRQLAQIVASDRDRFLGYAMVHAARDAGRVAWSSVKQSNDTGSGALRSIATMRESLGRFVRLLKPFPCPFCMT